MNSELNQLYQEVILDHNKQPRNFHAMPESDRHAEGFNPLCGDRCTVYLRMDGDKVADVSFEGSGCAISKASSSIMTTAVKGKRPEEIEAIFGKFHDMVTGKLPKGEAEGLGKLQVFQGVSEFPARVKCASLAWHTLKAALENKGETVSTEKGEDSGSGA
ncbi:MAG TPA: SUF system NifU family Fe-S cluster assembly protein [bacterium]|nr:SUF system NifU family Fe-S cluster assembly protein [bacterium]